MLDHALDQRDRLIGVGAGVSAGQHADRAGLELATWTRWSMPRARPDTTT